MFWSTVWNKAVSDVVVCMVYRYSVEKIFANKFTGPMFESLKEVLPLLLIYIFL